MDENEQNKTKRTMSSTPVKKKKMRGDCNQKVEHRDQIFRKEWQNNSMFKSWLTPVKAQPKRAFCTCCKKEMNAEISVLKRHATSVGHLKNNKIVGPDSGQRTIFQCTPDPFAVKLQEQIKEAEIRKCAFIAENNLPIRVVDSMVAIDKKCYPDSKIAQGIHLGRTKATKVITNVIGPSHLSDLIMKLKENKFSAIIDESTDIGTIKSMAVCVRFHENNQIVTKFWKLVQVFSGQNADEGATAQRLFDLLLKCFTEENIPLENLIGFGSDGCNTMFGEKNSVSQRLQELLPGITVQKCLCHSLHLCASEACKELPRHLEDLVRNIYGIFKNSCKRQAEFRQFQDFYETDPHKILRPSQTRWLSLRSVVNRILEQWIPLKQYFQSKALEHRLLAAESVLTSMRDPFVKQFLHFLQWVLPKFVDLNELFQSDHALITIVYSKMCTSYKDLLSTYMDKSYLDRTPLDQIDPTDTSKFISLHNIYLGVKVLKGFSESDILSCPNKVAMEKHFRERCRNFIIKGCSEMKKRFDFSLESPFAKMTCLNPQEALSIKRPESLNALIEVIPRICDPLDLDHVQLLDDQWRLLIQQEVGKDIQELEADKFWAIIRDHKDLAGKQLFKELGLFACSVMSLPHSSAACERIFSKINLIKTRVRNRMVTTTLNGLLLTSQYAKEGNGSNKCNVTPEMLSAMNVENLKPKKKLQEEKVTSLKSLYTQEEEDHGDDDDDGVFEITFESDH